MFGGAGSGWNNVGKLSPILTDEFAITLRSAGRKIDFVQMALDRKKWYVAELVNLEWRDEGYEAEGVNKREYYAECCKLLPVRIFGQSGETLRRWCETQSHYADEKDIMDILAASSFDHLLKAKRLHNNGKVESAIYAVAIAISKNMTADEMANHFDPEHDGKDSRHFTLEKLFTLSERAWIPKEAAEHLLEAARIIKKSLDSEVTK